MLSLVNSLMSPSPLGWRPPASRPRDEQEQAKSEPDFVRYLRRALDEGGRMGECFHAIFLDANRAYIDDRGMGLGEASSISVRLRDLFAHALAVETRSMVIAHSHPSGMCRPSQRDITETRRLAEVGKTLEIELLDHLIITQHAAYSMRSGGEL